MFPIYEALDPQTAALTQASDITPIAMADTNISIAVAEYGAAVQQTALLKATAYTEVGKAASELVGINRARSVDIIARDVSVGGSNVIRVASRAARTSLTSSDTLTWNFLMQSVARARGWNIPPDTDGYYVCPCHPVATAELAALSLWQTVSQYQKEGMEIYDGEVGMLAGIRFVETYNGKLYYSGGTTAQAATTSSASVAAGDTSIGVASATGLSVGDFITVGALEASIAEQVQITAVSGTTLTISGVGNTQGNFGFRYAHASGVAVTEAEQIAGLPLMGPKSVGKAFSTITGNKGNLTITGPFDVLGRFVNYGWFLIAGWAITSQHWTLRLEATTSFKHIGAQLGDYCRDVIVKLLELGGHLFEKTPNQAAAMRKA